MLISEIEINSSSLTVSVAIGGGVTPEGLYDLVSETDRQFDLENEVPGFHDAENQDDLLRGWYSFIEPFEVEELIDGITTKKLHKRIRSCEFITDGTRLFSFGHSGAQRLLRCAISTESKVQFDLHGFEYAEMSQTGDRFSKLKSVVLLNPKECEVRQARLSGHIENYTDYNVVNTHNHGIKSISGMLDTPLGPLNITVGQKGIIRLGVRKGMLMTFECLVWILDLVLGKHSGEAANPPHQSF